MGLTVVLEQVAGDSVDLHGQLACGGDHNGRCAIPGHKLCMIHELHTRYEER